VGNKYESPVALCGKRLITVTINCRHRVGITPITHRALASPPLCKMSQQFRSIFGHRIWVIAARKKLGESCIVAEESDTGTFEFWPEEISGPTDAFWRPSTSALTSKSMHKNNAKFQ
jgi:hypothetical protein